MLRLLSDENFNGEVVRGLRRRYSKIDLVRVQEVGLSGAADPGILQWAADQQRVLLTHDRATIPEFAYERVRQGLPMPGVLLIDDQAPIGDVMEDVWLFAECNEAGELEGKVLFL